MVTTSTRSTKNIVFLLFLSLSKLKAAPHFLMEPRNEAREDTRQRIEPEPEFIQVTACDPQNVLEYLFSENLVQVHSGVKTLRGLLKQATEGLSLIPLSSSLFRILERLLTISLTTEGDAKTDSDACLCLFLSLDPRSAFGRSETCFFVILMTEGPEHLKLGVSVIERVLNIDPVFKNQFVTQGGLDMLVALPIERLPEDLREIFASIIAITIREDFPLPMPDPVIESLLLKLMSMIGSGSERCLLGIARACYYFVLPSDRLCIFMRNGLHIVLRDAFPRLSVDAKTFALSAFGMCFLCDEWAETMAADIPLSLFAEHLNCDDERARIDTAIALRNVFDADVALTRLVFESGLMSVIVSHLKDDIFSVRQELIRGLETLIKRTNVNALNAFLIPELFEALDDAFQSGNKKVMESLQGIAAMFVGTEISDDMIKECLTNWDESQID